MAVGRKSLIIVCSSIKWACYVPSCYIIIKSQNISLMTHKSARSTWQLSHMRHNVSPKIITPMRKTIKNHNTNVGLTQKFHIFYFLGCYYVFWASMLWFLTFLHIRVMKFSPVNDGSVDTLALNRRMTEKLKTIFLINTINVIIIYH